MVTIYPNYVVTLYVNCTITSYRNYMFTFYVNCRVTFYMAYSFSVINLAMLSS